MKFSFLTPTLTPLSPCVRIWPSRRDCVRLYEKRPPGQQEFSSRQAGLASGIVLVCLVPILLIVICVAFRVLQSRKQEREREEALER